MRGSSVEREKSKIEVKKEEVPGEMKEKKVPEKKIVEKPEEIEIKTEEEKKKKMEDEKKIIEEIEALQVRGGYGQKWGATLRVNRTATPGLYVLKSYRKGHFDFLTQGSLEHISEYVERNKEKGYLY